MIDGRVVLAGTGDVGAAVTVGAAIAVVATAEGMTVPCEGAVSVGLVVEVSGDARGCCFRTGLTSFVVVGVVVNGGAVLGMVVGGAIVEGGAVVASSAGLGRRGRGAGTTVVPKLGQWPSLTPDWTTGWSRAVDGYTWVIKIHLPGTVSVGAGASSIVGLVDL